MSFIKLDRALLGWRYAHDPNYVALWVHILLMANHKETKWEDIDLMPGEFITSIGHMAEQTGLSAQKVRTILNHLNGEELTSKSTNRFTLIKVMKWGEYQGSGKPINKQINKQSTNNQQTINNRQEYKEYKNKRNIYIDTLPVYDASGNKKLNDDDIDRLLKLRKGEA